MEMCPLQSPLMLRGRIMLVQRNKVKASSRDSKKEEGEDASIVTGLATMLESVLIRRILLRMMTTITTVTISKAMLIDGTTSSKIKERGMLLLFDMKMVNLPKGRETPSMRNVML
jgi:hypothetical protein